MKDESELFYLKLPEDSPLRGRGVGVSPPTIILVRKNWADS